MTTPLYKGQADRLATHLATTHGIRLKRSSVLEALAAVHGARDWNTLAAGDTSAGGSHTPPASADAPEPSLSWGDVFTAKALQEHILISVSSSEQSPSPYSHLRDILRRQAAPLLLISGRPSGNGSRCTTDHRHTALPSDLAAGPSTDLCVSQLLNLFPRFESSNNPGAQFLHDRAGAILYPLLSVYRALNRSLSSEQLLCHFSDEDSLQNLVDELVGASGIEEERRRLLLALAPYTVKTKAGKRISIDKAQAALAGLLGRICLGMGKSPLPFNYRDVERLVQERTTGHFEFDSLSDGMAGSKLNQLIAYLKTALANGAPRHTSSTPYVVILENVQLLDYDALPLFELAKQSGVAIVVVNPSPALGTLTYTRIHQAPSSGSAIAGLLDKEGLPLAVVNDWVKHDPGKYLVLAGRKTHLLGA